MFIQNVKKRILIFNDGKIENKVREWHLTLATELVFLHMFDNSDEDMLVSIRCIESARIIWQIKNDFGNTTFKRSYMFFECKSP